MWARGSTPFRVKTVDFNLFKTCLKRLRRFVSAWRAGSKGCMWTVTADMFVTIATMWDVKVAKGFITGIVWAVAASMCSVVVTMGVYHNLCACTCRRGMGYTASMWVVAAVIWDVTASSWASVVDARVACPLCGML